MAFLASDVTAEAREHFAGFYPDTHAQALALVNKAHSRIVRECGLYAVTTETLSLTAGTYEYALDSDVVRVLSATYYQSADSYQPLTGTSVDELDSRSPAWRDLGSSIPSAYYEEGGMLGLFPKPSITTSSGYPSVILRVQRANVLTALTDSLPAQLPTIDAYAHLVLSYWAARNAKDQLATYLALSEKSLESLKSFVQNRLVRVKPTVRPSFPFPRNR